MDVQSGVSKRESVSKIKRVYVLHIYEYVYRHMRDMRNDTHQNGLDLLILFDIYLLFFFL